MQIKADRTGIRIASFASGWRAVVLVAATYVYFLIFAQFGFLKRLAAAGIGDDALKPIMAAMAAGGIAASLLAARASASGAAWRLRFALLGCAAAAGCTLLPLSAPAFTAVAFLIGASLGPLTVTLVANLGLWMGAQQLLLWWQSPRGRFSIVSCSRAGLQPRCRARPLNVPAASTSLKAASTAILNMSAPAAMMWSYGGPRKMLKSSAANIPLIGNRRQGPDLSEVGARRSPLWLHIHLIDPRLLSYDSPMPSYAWLFRD